MNKYTLGGIVVLTIFALFLLLQGDRLSPRETTEQGETSATETELGERGATAPMATTQIVTYTNQGFSPASITVDPGTTVTFINQSDAPMWVASAVHPTHLLYPEFDAKMGVPKGDSWSFTFMKSGEHPYHDHLLLGKYGKVIVK